MPVTLPTNGKADWTDYEDFWRELDAEWIQDRIVIRVADDAQRDALVASPGGVVYNTARDRLEWRSSAGGYKAITPVSANLVTTEAVGPPATTTISHKDASLKGVVFGAAEVGITNKLNVLNGTLVVEATGISLKTGAKTAKLTTDDNNLISDTQIWAPGLVITGAGTLYASGKAATLGSLVVEGVLTTASLNASGAVNAASGTIGGVALATNKAVASGGYDTQGGSFYGDANSAIMRAVARTGAYVQAAAGGSVLGPAGTFVDLYGQARVMGAAAGILHYNSGKYISPSFYSAADPGVGNYPEGTIWIT